MSTDTMQCYINIVIGTIIASLQAGAVSYLYFADRLYQLPLGIVGIAIGVVLLPDLSRQLRAGDAGAALESQNRALEFALMLTIPSSLALGIAAEPIVSVLFEHGAFKAADTAATATALQAFALGLPAFVLIKVFQPAFFAREDTKTPMWFATASVVVNVVGSLALFFVFQSWGWMPHVGIALATSAAGWMNALSLWRVLARNREFVWDQSLTWSLLYIVLASVAMGGAILLAVPHLEPLTTASAALPERIAGLVVLVLGGSVIYFSILLATGTFRLQTLLRRGS